jgi:hypothetical protein
MFCPGCGFQVNDDLKFCRQCGAKLYNVRDAMSSRSTGEKFDWSRTWWAGMMYSAEELERMRGVTPEEQRLNEERRRLNEIKGGIITSSIGVGVMIAFYFFFGAVARHADPKAAEIVSNLWLLGIIPTLIGAGLLINGFFHQPASGRSQRTTGASGDVGASGADRASGRAEGQNNRSTDR